MRKSYSKWAKYLFCPLFLCLILNVSAQDQWQFTDTNLKSYEHLLSLRLYHEDVSLSEQSPSTQYLKHFQRSVEMLISEGDENLDEYEKLTDYTLNVIKKTEGDSPYRKFYTADILLQSAFIHLKIGHELTAAWQLRKAYREVNRNIEEYPNFLPQYKTIGLLHVILGSVPDKYNWILSLMGMRGSVQEGIDELNKLGNSTDTFRKEAKLLLLLIQGYMLSETNQSMEGLNRLYLAEPENLLTGYVYVSVLMKAHQTEKASAILEDLKRLSDREDYIDFKIITYLKAEALLQKGEYSSAIKNYQEFVSSLQGKNYLKDSYYKTGLAYWLLDKSDSADYYFAQADKSGTSITEADKHANRQLNNDEKPNKAIMKARLFTDGGYYNQALTVLDQVNKEQLDKKEQVELNYRKARILHLTDKTNEAIAFYKLTINSGEKNNWYFAPNSALQLGHIYEEQNQIDLAKKYYKKALDYKDYEYENSIENKAKSALGRLED